MPQATLMRDMFDRVAPRYDLVNRVLSAGSDIRWRRAVAGEVVAEKPRTVLDVCTGTGDQCLEILRHADFSGKVIGTDISQKMLGLGKKKGLGHALAADTHALALRPGAFDCATMCFGIRNLEDLDKGLGQIRDALRPGGKLIILEFSRPGNPALWAGYRWYLTKILPALGGALSGQGQAYRYLASSIEKFLTPEQLGRRLEHAGFEGVRSQPLSGGIVAVTTGYKREH